MGARIRTDGTILCAAMHPPMPGDEMIDDSQLYQMAVLDSILVASSTHQHRVDCSGGANCTGDIIGGSGSRLCGDGLWFRSDNLASGRKELRT